MSVRIFWYSSLKGTVTTLMSAPVSFAKSGARRCSGSAIWGPVNVRTVTLTPAKFWPDGEAAADADAAADGAVLGAGLGDGDAAEVQATATSMTLASRPPPFRDLPFAMCPPPSVTRPGTHPPCSQDHQVMPRLGSRSLPPARPRRLRRCGGANWPASFRRCSRAPAAPGSGRR